MREECKCKTKVWWEFFKYFRVFTKQETCTTTLNVFLKKRVLTYLCTLSTALVAYFSTPTTRCTGPRWRTFGAVAPFLGKPKNVFCQESMERRKVGSMRLKRRSMRGYIIITRLYIVWPYFLLWVVLSQHFHLIVSLGQILHLCTLNICLNRRKLHILS